MAQACTQNQSWDSELAASQCLCHGGNCSLVYRAVSGGTGSAAAAPGRLLSSRPSRPPQPPEACAASARRLWEPFRLYRRGVCARVKSWDCQLRSLSPNDNVLFVFMLAARHCCSLGFRVFSVFSFSLSAGPGAVLTPDRESQ